MRLLRVSEVSERLGCGRETIRRLIATGRLKAVKLPGGHFRIAEEDLAGLLRPAERESRG
ncbi:MAG: excisionase family DNA-binding protein [Dehalococcoidia bacterium]|nr:excisionase family DNA-binding protein [Dehalococcoidia bacterium]